MDLSAARRDFPAISVVINNHNKGAFLAECISSVLSQTDAPEEIIVVDDGSSDKSREIIGHFAARHPAIKTVFAPWGGQLSALAHGFPAASGDVLLLLDADDRFVPDHVRTMRARWREFDDADLMYCRFNMFGDAELIEVWKRRRRGIDPSHLMGPIDLEAPYRWGYCMALLYFLPGIFLGNITSTLSLRVSHARRLGLREFLESGGFPVTNGADQFLLLSSALSGGKRVYVPDRTVDYRVLSEGDFHQNAGKYTFFARRFAADDWLLERVARSPDRMRQLLDFELAAVPHPSAGHAALYKQAAKVARRQMAFAERIRARFAGFVRALRLFLYRKGVNTFPRK